MKSYFVFTIILGAVSAVPIGRDDEITLVKQHQELNDDGSFSWGYENSDGTSQSQSGALQNVGTEMEGIEVQGAFSYPDKDTGSPISVKYTAGQEGFKPEGEHLPTPPPLPEYVKQLLKTIYGNAKKQVREAQAKAQAQLQDQDPVEYF